MDIHKKDLRHFSLIAVLVLILTGHPSFLQKSRVVTFQRFLNIQTSKADPPRLAFDEIIKQEKKAASEWDALRERQGASLLSGESSQKFAARNAAQALRTKKIVLQTMTFSREEVTQAQVDTQWIENLPVREQQRLQRAQEKFGVLDENWSSPSFHEAVARKISEIHNQISSSSSPEKVFIQGQNENGEAVSPQSIHTADVQVRTDSGDFELSGMLEVRGLPSGHPQWQIQLARYDDDVKKEDGRVDVKKSIYQIKVPKLSGALVAKMVDTSSGQVLGEGSLRLSSMTTAQAQMKSKITIAAFQNSWSSSFRNFDVDPSRLAGSPGGRSKPLAAQVLLASTATEGETDKSGNFSFDQVRQGSWGIMRAQSKGYHSSLYLVQSGQEKQWPLFRENMIQALKQIIKDQTLSSEVPETGSVVWGQVRHEGRALAGAEVQVEGLENYRAVYFNSLLIPDFQLTSTSENGFFVILDLPQGFHSLKANAGTVSVSHANVVVDDDTVSVAQLESTLQTEKVSVKVFDAFSGQPASAQLEMQSLSSALDVQGYAEIHLPPLQRLSFAKIHPQSSAYSEALQIYEDFQDSVQIPLIRTDWLQSLMAERKINQSPEAGVIVGFVPNGDFQCYLGHVLDFSLDQIVYFDAQGAVVPKAVVGGGFVIFNVPSGVQSVLVADTKSDFLENQIAPVDPSGLVVLKFH